LEKKKNPLSINLLIFDKGKKMPAALKKTRKFEKVYIERMRYTSDPMATKARNFESTSIFSSSTICREEKTPLCQDR
jgi:tartrate dehydratase alpha subunit/fumarate hydratase class I-like protein